jgi:hypothetical protein
MVFLGLQQDYVDDETSLLVQASLGGRRWDQAYQAKYGSVADFMRTHPEAFYQRFNGAFYRPDAPARMPPVHDTNTQQHSGGTTGISKALIIAPGMVPLFIAFHLLN